MLKEIQELTQPGERGSFRIGICEDKLFGLFGPSPEAFMITQVKPATGKKHLSISRIKTFARTAQQLANELYLYPKGIRPQSYEEFTQEVSIQLNGTVV